MNDSALSHDLSPEFASRVQRLAKRILMAGYISLIVSVMMLTVGTVLFLLAPAGLFIMALATQMIRAGKAFQVPVGTPDFPRSLDDATQKLATVFVMLAAGMLVFSLAWIAFYVFMVRMR